MNIIHNTHEDTYILESEADENRKKVMRDLKTKMLTDLIFSTVKDGLQEETQAYIDPMTDLMDLPQ